jgi:pimeloyl-ACP methyl ester carboxylesterase
MDATCQPLGSRHDLAVTSADGTRLAAGVSGDGEPVVFVHGSAGGLGSWDPLLPFLSEQFETWTYARRGYVPSGAPRGEKRFADDVADLRAVVQRGGSNVHVVGGSYGATVALHTAREGVGIRSLTVFEPPLFSAGAALEPVLKRYRSLLAAGALGAAELLFAEEVARVPEALLAAMASDADVPADPDQVAARTAAAIGSLHDLEAMRSDSIDLRRWSAIDVPVLVLQGSETWSPMPETMEELFDVLPNAERAVLAGHSHFAPHTGPEMFAKELLRFVDCHASR